MKLSMTYRVRTKGFNHIFNETVRLYRQAVSFFVDVCLKEWKGERKVRGSIDFIRFSQLFPFPFRL